MGIDELLERSRRKMLAATLQLLLLLLSMALVVAKETAVERQKEHPSEVAHRKNMRFFFSIGEGFEGSASDWTEYLVWGVGVIGVLYYMASPNARRNPYRDDDEDDEFEPQHGQQPHHAADGDELFADPPA